MTKIRKIALLLLTTEMFRQNKLIVRVPSANYFAFPIALTRSNSSVISLEGALVQRLTIAIKTRPTRNAGSSSYMPNTPPMGLIRYFQIKTVAPPDTMPEIAPGRVVRFQNREQITSGPKAAPKPAHANETMPNTELSGLRAIIIPRIAMPTTVRRAASMLFFSGILRWNASRSMFSDTLEAAARSWESAVDIVLARIPARIRPAMIAGNAP